MVDGRLKVPSCITPAPAGSCEREIEKTYWLAFFQFHQAPDRGAELLGAPGNEHAALVCGTGPPASVVGDRVRGVEDLDPWYARDGGLIGQKPLVPTKHVGGVFRSRGFEPSTVGELLQPEFSQFAREIFAGLRFEQPGIATLKNALSERRGEVSVLVRDDS